MPKKLPEYFYQSSDVALLAQKLLGKKLCTHIDDELTAGLISETEAYDGLTDRASHAYLNKKTERTKVMFEPGGRTYVYFCYGIHHLLNIVTGPKDSPQAVLIRSIIPTNGLDTIRQRRGQRALSKNTTTGPGNVAQALGLTRLHTNTLLTSTTIWIEKTDLEIPEAEIITTPRIGIDYAGSDKDLPWRFVWQKK